MESVVDRLGFNAASLAISTLYFHGVFQTAFDPRYTENKSFYTMNSRLEELKYVPFMRTRRKMSYYKDHKYSIVGLDYHLQTGDILESLTLLCVKYHTEKDPLSKTPVKLSLPSLSFSVITMDPPYT